MCFNNPPIYTGSRDSHTRQVGGEKPDEDATRHPGLRGFGEGLSTLPCKTYIVLNPTKIGEAMTQTGREGTMLCNLHRLCSKTT